jgi:hypothetical protein
MNKKITEAQYIKDLKTVHPDISKEDIDWHVNMYRQSMPINEVEETNTLLYKMWLAMAAAKYPYSGNSLVCLPDGRQITREQHWKNLKPEEQKQIQHMAYEAFMVMSEIGLEHITHLALNNYLREK